MTDQPGRVLWHKPECPSRAGRVQSPYRVVDGMDTVADFDCHEDAVNFARSWNHAYPPPEYVEFTLDPATCDDHECECHV
jgi:hypothetical protein